MEECELCGRQTKDIYVLDVENVEIRACAKCAKGKKVIRTEIEKPLVNRNPNYIKPKSDEDRELVEGYGVKIRAARERMKLPIKVLAEMLSEKEHYLVRVEEEETRPTLELTKKLERALSIKLTQDVEEAKAVASSKGQSKGATIGDFIGG